MTVGRKTTPQKKKTRTVMYQPVEEELKNWLEMKLSQNREVQNKDIQKAARRIARKEGLDKFDASVGWITRFKERHGFSYRVPTKITTKTVFGDKELVGGR